MYGAKSFRDEVMSDFLKVLDGEYSNLESRTGIKRQSRYYDGYDYESLFKKSIDALSIQRDYLQNANQLDLAITKVEDARRRVEETNKAEQYAVLKKKKEDDARKGVAEKEILSQQATLELANFVDESKAKRKHLREEAREDAARKAANAEIHASQTLAMREQQMNRIQQPKKMTAKQRNNQHDAWDVLTNMVSFKNYS